MSFLLSWPKENMNPSAGRALPSSTLHWIGESIAQLTGILLLVKFPLFFGLSVPVHIPPPYKSAYRYLYTQFWKKIMIITKVLSNFISVELPRKQFYHHYMFQRVNIIICSKQDVKIV